MNAAIEIKENFQKELHSLYQKLDKKLTEVDSSTRTGDLNHSGYRNAIETLNQLKLHRLKIRSAKEWLKLASEKEWIEKKENLQAKYNQAALLIY